MGFRGFLLHAVAYWTEILCASFVLINVGSSLPGITSLLIFCGSCHRFFHNFPCLKLIEIVILWVYYTILFGFSWFRYFLGITYQFLDHHHHHHHHHLHHIIISFSFISYFLIFIHVSAKHATLVYNNRRGIYIST